jgi:cytochrome c-type biogenesis protein
MDAQPISWLGAFIAGFLSFLSPCVLPLIPAYLSFLAGTTLEEMEAAADAPLRRRLWLSALAFVLGFSILFVLLGASATLAGHWLLAHSLLFGRIAGVFLVILGLHVTGLMPLRFLMMEKRFHPSRKPIHFIGAMFVGMAFAFGWTPCCVGPMLAGILTLAGTQQTVGQGMLLLGIYSAGLGIPFLAAAAAAGWFLPRLHRWQRYLRWVEIAAGGLLIAMGIVMVTGSLGRIAAWFGAFKFLAL